MDMAMFEMMKPIMLESIISSAARVYQTRYLMRQPDKTAIKDKKEIIGLETAAETNRCARQYVARFRRKT